MEFDVQLRNEDGGLRYYPTFAEAYKVAKADEFCWKISFSLPTGERVRLIRQHAEGGCFGDDRCDYDFVLDQMDDAIARIEKSHEGARS